MHQWRRRADDDVVRAVPFSAAAAAAAFLVAAVATAVFADDGSEQQVQARLVGGERASLGVGRRRVSQVRDGRAHRLVGRAVPQQQRDGVHVPGRRGHHHGRGPVRPHADVLQPASVEQQPRARRPVQEKPQGRLVLRRRGPVVRLPAADHARHFPAGHRPFEKFLQRFLAPATQQRNTAIQYVRRKSEPGR